MAVKIPPVNDFVQQGFSGFTFNGETVPLSPKTAAGLSYMDVNFNKNVIRSPQDETLLGKIVDTLNLIFEKVNADTDEKKIIHSFKAITLAVKYISDPVAYDRVSGINNFFYNNGGDCEDWSYVIARVMKRLGFRSGAICLWEEDNSGHVVPWVASSTTFYIMERVEMLKSAPGYLWSIPLKTPGSYSDLKVNGKVYSGNALGAPRFTHPTLPAYRFDFDWISSFEIKDYVEPFIIVTGEPEKDESTIFYKHPNHAIALFGSEPEYKELYNITGFYSINRELLIGAISIAFLLYFLLK